MSARLRVLVVDDVITNRLLLRKILERENYEIVEAENGLEAINLVQAGGIDIALLDIMMPEMDGVTALKKIREHHSLTELPIIMVTAKNEDTDIVNSLTAGANDYITKPINSIVVLARVNTQARVVLTSKALLKTQQELATSQRMETVGLFAGAIAHNFNNLLGTIMGSAELIKDVVGDNSYGLNALKLINASTKRAADLTYSLLSFVGSESTGLCRSPSEVVNMTLPLLESVSGRRIRYVVELDDDLPALKISSADLSSILMQLLKNSITAIVEEGVISIMGKSTPQSSITEPSVTFTITDTGCGISEDYLQRVFEPFFSTKDSNDNDTRVMMALDGSGLGLTVAYNLVKQSGGNISLESTEGVGTTVTVELPVARADNVAV